MLKGKKKQAKVIALILCVALFSSCFPSGAFNASATKEKTSATDNTASNTEPIILGEIESQRSENTKVFYRNDGMNVSVTSLAPIHYKDTIGKWQDIDNTLSVVSGTDGQNYITNSKNSFKVMIPEKMESNKLVSIEKGNNTISFIRQQETKRKEMIDKEVVLQSQLDVKMQEVNKFVNLQGMVPNWREEFDCASVDVRKMLVSELINEVVIYKDRIEVNFKISFEDFSHIQSQK